MNKPQRPDIGVLYSRKAQYEALASVKAYLAFSKLPASEQQARREEWENYYAEARKTPAAENFFAMRDALRIGKLSEIRERSKWAGELREQGPTLKLPKGPEPAKLDHNQRVMEYKSLVNAIAQEEYRMKNETMMGVEL